MSRILGAIHLDKLCIYFGVELQEVAQHVEEPEDGD